MFYKGEIPFVRLLIPFSGGILLGYYFENELVYEFADGLALISTLILAVLIIQYKAFSVYRSGWIAGLCLYSFLLLIGYGLTLHVSQRFDKDHYSLQAADELIGVVSTEPKMSNGILRFETDIKRYYRRGKNYGSTGKLLLAVSADSAQQTALSYGDLVLIPAVYDSIEPPYNPGQFDYRRFLKNKQIYFQSLLTQEKIIILRRNSGNPVVSFALQLRKNLVAQFYTYLPDKDAAAFASTLILGYRAELSKELVEAYSRTGTMHVLSVSGMHVGIVFMVLSFLLKFMDKSRGLRLIRAVLIIAIVWFYALITGFSAPACRAAVMLSFVVLGKALNKNQNTYNLIAISAFFLLLYNPYFLFDAGFQLSYAAVTGLVYFHPKIYQTLYCKNKLLDFAWSYCALSLAAQLATFPVSIYYFHQFPVYFLLSNLFIVLPVAIIMYAGIIFMFMPFAPILYHLGMILNWLITFTNNILFYIENIPFSSWNGLWINAFQFVLLYLILLCFILKGSFSYPIRLPLFVMLIVFCMSISIVSFGHYDRHELIFYNLRKHTAMAYLYRRESVIITNLGAFDKQTEFSILPALHSRGSVLQQFINPAKSFSGKFYQGEGNVYQFGGYRVLRWDASLDKLKFHHKIAVDVLFISGSPRINLQDLNAFVGFSILIIDANNPDYKIANWVKEARDSNIPFYVLKKNPAYVVKL